MNPTMNRAESRKAERLINDPVVQKLVALVSNGEFSHFVFNAQQNRPEEIKEEDWTKIVNLVINAGRKNGTLAPDAPAEPTQDTTE